MLCVLGKSQYKMEMLMIGKFHCSKAFKSCFKRFRMSKAVHLKLFCAQELPRDLVKIQILNSVSVARGWESAFLPVPR